MTNQPAIEIRDLRKSYGSTVVLDGIDLTVPRGTVLALLGPNGAGKTTLIRILATLLPPDSGTALVEGIDVVRRPRSVRGRIGLTGQHASIDELLSGRENLVMLGRLARLDRAAAGRRATELLSTFDLTAVADQRIDTYSGGMRRRIDLAASLMSTPDVLFLDEPTTGLDPRSRRALWGIIRDLVAGGLTIFLTTQYLEEADQLADHIVVLDRGRIVSQGSARVLTERVGDERLTVTLRSSADLDNAAAVLTPLTPMATSAPGGSSSVTVSVTDSEDIRTTLNLLAGAGIGVADVHLAPPTLDDVFLAVTGSHQEA